MDKKIQVFFCVASFTKNMKIRNGCHFWRDKLFFENWVDYSAGISSESKISSKLLCRDIQWVKILSKSLMVFGIQAFLCFAIFAKNSKQPPFLVRQIICEI